EPLRIAFGNDDDFDGINSDVEAMSPNNGDNNFDGVLDKDQSDVASFPTQNGVDFISLDAKGRTLRSANVQPATTWS
ncbi:hypothetical protein, partial [Priestia megaterium]|uniref:hypothetical protein n=1 Tax=Priestia megaterium TaxID=1404 RepID=UPI0035B6ABA6